MPILSCEQVRFSAMRYSASSAAWASCRVPARSPFEHAESQLPTLGLGQLLECLVVAEAEDPLTKAVCHCLHRNVCPHLSCTYRTENPSPPSTPTRSSLQRSVISSLPQLEIAREELAIVASAGAQRAAVYGAPIVDSLEQGANT